MNIDITTLRNGYEDYVVIDEIYSFSEDELKNTEIIRLDNLKVNGDITKDNLDEYIIDVDINGVMVLPCAISLKPVNYSFETKIVGNLEKMYQEIGKKYENNQKTIDILPIIWENILMEIPIRVISEDLDDVKTKGEGWELITEDD